MIRPNGSVVPESELPDFVQTGMRDPKARMHDKRYNLQQAPKDDPLRLVKETWREYIYRRNRCLGIREKLQKGEVHQINDLITLNLDIWQFARDAIVNSEGPELLRAFWHAIENVTVLDPTSGSGAFLFAALRILETLYSDCLERMERFVEELAGKKHHPKQYSDFKDILARIAEHPNEQYFIFKSIIINNLFGVDIMEEAVEICKLRLFLKLVAQVETVEQIEPLPDIDFNIRAGNTLVGFASLEEVRKSQAGTLGFGMNGVRRIEEDAELVERAFRQFRAQQTTHGGAVTHKDKQELRRRLEKLDDELDRYLAGEYGIDVRDEKKFDEWKASHRPFHWFVEFYGIMQRGGFDVIIGNPPYVEYSKVKKDYTIRGYETANCGNLYAYMMERSGLLAGPPGRFGMIVPLSLCSSERMTPLRIWLQKELPSVFISNYEIFPSKLFNGAFQRLSIVIGSKHKSGTAFISKLHRWYAIERSSLIVTLAYTPMLSTPRQRLLFKLQNVLHRQVLEKLLGVKQELSHWWPTRSTKHFVFYQEATNYWAKAITRVPFYKKNGQVVTPAHSRTFFLASSRQAHISMAALNSSLFYLWYISLSDGFHMNGSIVRSFPISDNCMEDEKVERTALMLDKDIRVHSFRTTRNTAKDKIEIEAFKMNASKALLDSIDGLFAKHYGFTDEELDFIINYDIKYRMGQNTKGEG